MVAEVHYRPARLRLAEEQERTEEARGVLRSMPSAIGRRSAVLPNSSST